MGVSVNLWVVNERWLFSLLWCAGASSVTTNSCHLLKNMDRPDLVMVSMNRCWIVASAVLCFVFSYFFKSLSFQSKCFCLCVSVTPDIQDNMDYIGHFIYFDNDWGLHFLLVRWGTMFAVHVFFTCMKNTYKNRFTPFPWFLCQENTVFLLQRR